MALLGIIQARMGSRRLPGKVLMPLAGKPIVLHLIDRLAQALGQAQIVVATSVDPLDTPLAVFCEERGIAVRRGSQNNVAERFFDILREFGPDYFVRVNADSPLHDPALIRDAFHLMLAERPDLVTNAWPRSFPKGLGVEILSSAFFIDAYPLLSEPSDFEHVTAYFYRNASKYRIRNLSSPEDFSHLSLAVDTKEDYDRLSALFSRMKKPAESYGWRELVDLCIEAQGKVSP